jgi:hypothetical protein
VSAFLALIAIAAEAAAPAWQLDFSPKVDWYDVTATGLVMVGNDRSISGVDPETGKAAWERTDLKKVGEIGVSHVPGTPTAMVLEAEYKLGQVPKGILHLLDVSTGKDLWTAEGGPVMWSRPQYADKALLYLTQEFTNKGISYTMHYVDLMSGAVKWEKEDYFEKMNAVLQQWPADPTRKMSPKMTLEGNQGIVVVDDGKAYLELWTEKQGLVKRDFATGAVLWSNPTKYVDNFVPVPRNGRPPITIAGDNVFVTDNGGRLLAYKLSTGAPVWEEKDAPKMLGNIYTVIPVGDDVLIAGDDTKTAFAMVIDGQTGQEAWDKPVKMGGLTSFLEVRPDNRLVLAEGKATGTVLHVIDLADGSEKVDAGKLPGGISYAEVQDGKFFATGSNGTKTYVQMRDLTTGQSAWSEEGYRAKGTIANLITHDGKVYFVDSTNHFNALDMADGKQAIDVELPVQGKGETVSTLLQRDNGTFVALSSQNVIGLKPDGSVAWKVYYPPPPPTGLQVAAGVALVAAAAASTAAAAQASYNEGYARGAGATSLADNYGVQADGYADMANAFGDAAADVMARAKASKASENYYFVLTKVGEGKDGGVGLVRVDLNAGTEAGSVVIDTRDPNYEIDEIAGWIYLLRDEAKLEGYRLQ